MNQPVSEQDLLSIVIVNYNTWNRLRDCLASLRRHPPAMRHEVIVVDNASRDGSAEHVQTEFPEVRLIRAESNLGYGAGANLGVRHACGQWLLLLNPDTEVLPGSIDTLLKFARGNPQAGVIGPQLMDGSGRYQPSALPRLSICWLLAELLRLHRVLPAEWRGRLFLGPYFRQPRTVAVPWLIGACHLIPRSVWETVGTLTEETFCGFDDYDYCLRTWRQGYEVWFCAEAQMVHHGSVAIQGRWSSWEVEQLHFHNCYTILSLHWPRWRVKLFCMAQLLACVSEVVRDVVPLRRVRAAHGQLDKQLRRNRIAFLYGLLLGRHQPIRRFQPSQS